MTKLSFSGTYGGEVVDASQPQGLEESGGIQIMAKASIPDSKLRTLPQFTIHELLTMLERWLGKSSDLLDTHLSCLYHSPGGTQWSDKLIYLKKKYGQHISQAPTPRAAISLDALFI